MPLGDILGLEGEEEEGPGMEPVPREGEGEEEFVERCMANEYMEMEHRELGERRRACQSIYEGDEEGGEVDLSQII